MEADAFKASCPKCFVRGITEPISNRQERYGYLPVHIEYSCSNCDSVFLRKHNDSVNSYGFGRIGPPMGRGSGTLKPRARRSPWRCALFVPAVTALAGHWPYPHDGED
jgi:hypothetical protein